MGSICKSPTTLDLWGRRVSTISRACARRNPLEIKDSNRRCPCRLELGVGWMPRSRHGPPAFAGPCSSHRASGIDVDRALAEPDIVPRRGAWHGIAADPWFDLATRPQRQRSRHRGALPPGARPLGAAAACWGRPPSAARPHSATRAFLSDQPSDFKPDPMTRARAPHWNQTRAVVRSASR